MRIAKFLAYAGVCSRRRAERYIEQGRVTLNGKVLETPAKVVSLNDRVTVDGKVIRLYSDHLPKIWMYHKPAGEIVSNHDPFHKRTIFDTSPVSERLVAVGRLDLNTEGLMLLTNFGWLAQAYMTSSWPRQYHARIFGPPLTESTFKSAANGIVIRGTLYKPCKIVPKNQERHLPKYHSNQWVTITLTEGKNREIHRIMEFFGYKVNRLIRTNFGPFSLDDLPVQSWKRLDIVDPFFTQLPYALPKPPGL